MTKAYCGYTQYVPAGAAQTLHTGQGAIYAILASTSKSSGVASVTFYDNTSGSGNVLLTLHLNPYQPVVQLSFEEYRPLRFETGLTVATGAEVECHVIVVG